MLDVFGKVSPHKYAPREREREQSLSPPNILTLLDVSTLFQLAAGFGANYEKDELC